MDFDWPVVVIVLFVTVIIGGFGYSACRGRFQKLFILAGVSGLFFYSGIGAAYHGMPSSYILFYTGFLAALVFSFILFLKIFASIAIRSEKRIPFVLGSWDSSGKCSRLLILVYFVIMLLPLMYPEFRLSDLLKLSPPDPNVALTFSERTAMQVRGEFSPINKLIEYVLILIQPFFLVALYYYRRRLTVLGTILGLTLYINYVTVGSIGRGSVMLCLAIFVLVAWFERPRARMGLVAFAIVAVLGFLYWSYQYSFVRLGADPQQVGLFEAVVTVLKKETSFPRDVGLPLIESGVHPDLGRYFLWILTLPIPKILTGPIEVARINYEISEIILGLQLGMRGWYVVLPGLVAESVYIFGKYFFWLHAVFIGVIFAFVCRLTERVPQFFFVAIYFALLFGYNLNRAGIAAVLPLIINNMLLFYLMVFLLLFKSRKANSQNHVLVSISVKG